jgi:hypothetical protein
MDLTDRIVDFLVEEHRDGKLTPEQVDKIVRAFCPGATTRDSSTATTIKMAIMKDHDCP